MHTQERISVAQIVREEQPRGRPTLWALLLAVGCASPFHARPSPHPLIAASDDVIRDGYRQADLVVLATPEERSAEQLLASGISLAGKHGWWNVLVTVDTVYRGKLSRAKYLDYGSVPAWRVPPLPFRLERNQILVQQSDRWQTAPIVVGQPGIYFFKKCYNCAELPHQSSTRYTASPWFAILALDTVMRAQAEQVFSRR